MFAVLLICGTVYTGLLTPLVPLDLKLLKKDKNELRKNLRGYPKYDASMNFVGSAVFAAGTSDARLSRIVLIVDGFNSKFLL